MKHFAIHLDTTIHFDVRQIIFASFSRVKLCCGGLRENTGNPLSVLIGALETGLVEKRA